MSSTDIAERSVAERIAALEAATKPKTAEEVTKDNILATLSDLGGRTVQDDEIKYHGNEVILPERWDGKLDSAIKYLMEMRDALVEEVRFHRTYRYRPLDGAAAFQRAMLRLFGTAGQGRAQFTFFGKKPPEYRVIETGPGKTMQVPWGTVAFSPLGATFRLVATEDKEVGMVFHIIVDCPKMYRKHAEGLLTVIQDELEHHSIYRGQAITADPEEPRFLDPYATDPSKVIYSAEAAVQLEANVWTVLNNSKLYRDMKLPLKRAFLLEGPYGSGKTLAGVITAQHALRNNWTFIQVRSTDDPYQALQTARLYAPAVVWIEDLDIYAANKPRDEVSKLLDALDGVQSKGSEVMAGFTTNFADVIEKGVLRPGRIDAVIHIGALDPDGFQRLIQAVVPGDILDGGIKWDDVADAFKGYLPSFAVEAAQRAVRYAVARSGGKPDVITTEDLVAAAVGLRPQFDLVENASEAGHTKPTLDSTFATVADKVVRQALRGTKMDDYGEPFVVAESNGKH